MHMNKFNSNGFSEQLDPRFQESMHVCGLENDKNELSKSIIKKALVVIDIQNDITKNYKEIIDNINKAIDWAVRVDRHVVYIKHENLSAGTRIFKPNTYGAELASDLRIVSENVFTKYKSNALSCQKFIDFINNNEITEFYIVGADATVCVKSTCYNLLKANYKVTVLSDCITSWDKKKIPEMIQYYENKGSKIISLSNLIESDKMK